MRYLAIFTVFLVTACGGGSENTPENPSQPPPATIDSFSTYSYSLQLNGDTREYRGEGTKRGDVIYFYPQTVANSDYSVIAEATFTSDTTLTFRLFSLSSREVVKTIDVDYDDGEGYDSNGNWYGFTLEGGDSHIGSFATLNGVDEYGIDKTLCYYDLTTSDNEIDGEFYSCSDPRLNGSYSGSVNVINGKTVGVLTNDDHAMVVHYE